MLALSQFFANAQQIPFEGLIAIGGVCLLIGAWFSFAVFNDTSRASLQWCEDGSGPAMSPLGAGAFALSAYLFALLLFAHAFGWVAVSSFTFDFLLAVIFLTVIIALRDYARNRKRI